jgi:hypothetical protein
VTTPEPYVDPADVSAVAEVLAGTLQLMGPAGLGDLLARLPGVRVVPATPARLFRPAAEGGVWVGPEHLVRLDATPVVDQHVVGGVVLQRSVVPPARVPGVLAALVVDLARDEGTAEETAVVLTAAREVIDRL